MSRNYPDDVSNRDFDDPPDFLHDKPQGFCPWCSAKLFKSSETEWTGFMFCPKSSCMEYDSFTDEVENRERYARQAEEFARVQEHVNKELARRGE